MSYLPEPEQHLIGLVLNDPSVWPELNLLASKDFSEVRRPIYQVIKQQLDQTPPGSVAPVILVERLKSYANGGDVGGVDALTYLEGLQRRGRMIDPKEAINLLKELKTATVRRELIEACDEAKAKLKKAEKLDEMVGAVDQALSDVNTQFITGKDAVQIFADIREKVEERGNNPVDPNTLGYTGPLPSFNETFGSDLIAPASLTICAARTANGKSAFGFFYTMSVAEAHGIPVLWSDVGEMTLEQLQMRAVCALSLGRVPLWAIKSGEWRKEAKWEKIVRQEVWPRVKKILMYYQPMGGMSPKEKIQFYKRFYYNKVGRGNFLLIAEDYLKGIENVASGNKNQSEWQSMGYYLSDVKTLITEDIKASYWAGVQANRTGIHQGKKLDDVVDSEAVISMSDRISHNASTILLLRNKVTDELAAEKNMFGNVVVKPLKTRELSARNAHKLLRPVKTPKGGYVANYFNLNFESFHYRDLGMYSDMLTTMGMAAVDMSSNNTERKMP